MRIKCWGARGSIPVSGPQHLKYGGDTTCLEIRNSENHLIIVDAGSGIRRLGNTLDRNDREDCHLLFTHAHWDHLMGFPFFKPIYLPGTHIEAYGCPFAQKSVERMISLPMESPFFPVPYENISATVTPHGYCKRPFHVGPLKVSPILLSHPNQGIGYKFKENGKTFVFLTDNELTYRHENSRSRDDYRDFSEGADLLIHDAEYTREEYEKRTHRWGHTVWEDALQLALDAGVGQFGLCHHNQERSDEQIDGFVESCRQIIKEKNLDMTCFAAAAQSVIEL